MRKRRQIEIFSISFLDLISGALGAVIILYVALPKNIPQTNSDIEEKNKSIEILETHAKKLEDEAFKNQQKIEELTNELNKLKVIAPSENKVEGGKDLDVGFKFKGNRIAFLIDTSFSMTEEDRMGQVKAGLKMLITSLSNQYQIEVISYPFGSKAPFKSLFGVPTPNTNSNKNDIFNYIYNLKPYGGTPTRQVLLHVLDNYDVTDIVLLTDGAPSLHNSNKKDDIFDIIAAVRELNRSKKVQINCIGVGRSMTQDKTSEKYQFLHLLSTESNGFFVGF